MMVLKSKILSQKAKQSFYMFLSDNSFFVFNAERFSVDVGGMIDQLFVSETSTELSELTKKEIFK